LVSYVIPNFYLYLFNILLHVMKKIYASILLSIACYSFSQTKTNQIDIPADNLSNLKTSNSNLSDFRNDEINNDINQPRDKNLEKALEVVAPIESHTVEEKTPMDFVMEDANKVKMEEFSDVKHEELTNETYIEKDEEIINETRNNYNNNSSFGEKILKTIGLIGFWFVAGFLINFFFYSGKPDHLVGKSQTAKTLHILLNIFIGIALLLNFFS